MKKSIFALGLMFAALTLTNCTKNEEISITPEVSTPFSLFANVDTRTANDGMNTKWVDGDQINVFHAEKGSTVYINDTPYQNSTGHPFVIEDATSGLFKGTLFGALDASKSYDWYLFYPYSSYIKTPANTSNGYSTIGHDSRYSLTQTGNSNMDHICSDACPLVGIAKNVAAGTTPNVTMYNASSVVKFVVTNSFSKAITISQIAFTAPESIIGSYFINFSQFDPENDNSITYTEKYEHVAETAKLTVKDGESIAVGESAEFYIPIKPFTAAANSEFTITIAATDGTNNLTFEKSITATKATTFAPGKIKSINVDGKFTVTTPKTIAEVLNGGAGIYLVQDAWVVATYARGFLLTDSSSKYILCYQGENGTVPAVGTVVEVSGEVTTHAGLLQFAESAKVTATSKTKTVNLGTPTAFTGADLDAYINAPVVQYVSFEGTLNISGSYYNVKDIDGATTAIGSISYPDTDMAAQLADLNGKGIKATGFMIGVSSDTYTNMMITAVEATGDDPETPTVGQSKEDALTVAEAKALYDNGTTGSYWVKGQILGSYNNDGVTSTLVATNLAIGSDDNNMPVELPKGDIRTALNLVDNPGNLGKTLYIKGSLAKYFSVAGIKSPTEYALEGSGYPAISAEDPEIVAADGATISIPYTIDNPVSGNSLTVTSSETWVSNISVASSSFSVTVAKNEETASRTATLTLKYSGAADKTITITQSGQPNTEAGVFTLLTDASQLAVGKKIIIAANGSNKVLSTTQNKNNRVAADFIHDGNPITPSGNVQIITLEAGTVAGTFAFNVGNGYLYAASSSSNYLRTQTENDANGSWKITIATDGTATIKAQGANTRNWLRYNKSSSIFACYGSGQEDVMIYLCDN